MKLQEMLTTKNPESITDGDIKAAAYGIVYGEFAPGLAARQRELRGRLRELEAGDAAKTAERKASLRAKLQRMEADLYSDEDVYADK